MKKLGNESAFTLIELLVVIAIIVIFAEILLPHGSSHVRATIAQCMSNQKQIATAHLEWANDHNNKFPAQNLVASDGNIWLETSHAASEFQMLSNYLHYPTVFVCPADKAKHATNDLQNFRDENVSYFINMDATINNASHAILTGDRNLQADGYPVKSGLFFISTNLDMSWTREMHWRRGVLAFVDGHAENIRTNQLNSYISNLPLATNRLWVP